MLVKAEVEGREAWDGARLNGFWPAHCNVGPVRGLPSVPRHPTTDSLNPTRFYWSPYDMREDPSKCKFHHNFFYAKHYLWSLETAIDLVELIGRSHLNTVAWQYVLGAGENLHTFHTQSGSAQLKATVRLTALT